MELLRKVTNPSFRFVVEVNGAAAGAFTECDLPTVAWDVKEVKEGGLNTYVHQLPAGRQKSTITLRNGVGTSDLSSWFLQTMGETFDRRTITVILKEPRSHAAVMTWEAKDALPTKWSGPSLKSGENSIAIQSLEFTCGEITITPSTS